MTKIFIHNDGKGKWQSFEASSPALNTITDCLGYGDTMQASILDLRNKMIAARLRLQTAIQDIESTNMEITETDCQGNEIVVKKTPGS